jgi:hypothetical protein
MTGIRLRLERQLMAGCRERSSCTLRPLRLQSCRSRRVALLSSESRGQRVSGASFWQTEFRGQQSFGDSIRNSPFQTRAKSVKVEELTERGKPLQNLPILSP